MNWGKGVLGREPRHEMTQQHRNFRRALSQRWQRNRESTEAVVQIFSEPPVFDSFANIDVSGGQHAHVDVDHGFAAQAEGGDVLQHVQQPWPED